MEFWDRQRSCQVQSGIPNRGLNHPFLRISGNRFRRVYCPAIEKACPHSYLPWFLLWRHTFCPLSAPQSAKRSQQRIQLGHISGGPGLRLAPLEGYIVPTEGAIFHCIRCSLDGHIFLLCGAPQVYELAYESEAGWFHPKCRLQAKPNTVFLLPGRVARLFRTFKTLSIGALGVLSTSFECSPAKWSD